MKQSPRTSRREFLTLTGAAGFSLAASPMFLAAESSGQAPRTVNAGEALRRLLAGNKRFVKGQCLSPRRSPKRVRAVAEAQYPEAAVVGCADSRVPPEILFDVGVGDIFVVRVAGNVIGGAGVSVEGSIEYAVAELNVPLIVVLGHSGCGAVKAAMKQIDAKNPLPGAINGLVELIQPAVAKSRKMPGDPLENAIRENVNIGVERLDGLEPILARRVEDGRLKVVGAVYDLKTGAVTLVKQGK